MTLNPHLKIFGDFHLEESVADFRDAPEKPAGGHHLIALAEALHQILMLALAALVAAGA